MLGPSGVFFEGFLQHPVMVGSIIPSSRFTIDKMLAPVDWDECRLFVEYGPGVGTFCRPVLDRLRRDGALIVIDTNPLFIDYLQAARSATAGSPPVLGSAEDVEDIVRAHGHEQADYVLSGLPFSTLPDGVGPAIAAATHTRRCGPAALSWSTSSPPRRATSWRATSSASTRASKCATSRPAACTGAGRTVRGLMPASVSV